MKKFLSQLTDVLNDFISLIYPNICLCCDNVLVKQENLICTKCIVGLPRTHFHLVEDNPIEHIFWGRVRVEKATSYFFFQKGSRYQKLMHQLKYKGLREIGVEMGKKFGAELMGTNYFDDVDLIVPVPLHPKKERRRGYNQSLAIAEGLAFSLKKEIDPTILYRKHYSETQTRKGRFERWQNVNDLFEIRDRDSLENKHVLLVDDIVTTGSTLEVCASVILQSGNVKLSIATLAFTSN